MNKNITYIIAIIIFAGLLYTAVIYKDTVAPLSPMDNFAKCLGEKGAKFYGAYWCPHCVNQKKLFGESAQYLPYIECAIQGQNGQEKVCTNAGIDGYPTWKFADNSEQGGEISLAVLGEKTGCELKLDNRI